MREVDIAIVGAGPAGLSAAAIAAQAGARVTVLEEYPRVGGHLAWQIHTLDDLPNGLAGQRAGAVGAALHQRAVAAGASVLTEAVAWSIFQDNVLGVVHQGKAFELKSRAVILATGSYERAMGFPGWTLPGIMKSSAARILMHVHRFLPGQRALVVGSDDSGLDTAADLALLGCKVLAVVEEGSEPLGQPGKVAALRERGVDVLCRTVVKGAYGKTEVRQVRTAQLDETCGELPLPERAWEVDLVCLAPGSTPSVELAGIAGCEMQYVAKLGGFVPVHGDDMQTSVPGLFVAGDAAGIGTPATAILSGQTAGKAAVGYTGR